MYIPRTQMACIFEGQFSKTIPFPTKTRVLCVLGIYTYNVSVDLPIYLSTYLSIHLSHLILSCPTPSYPVLSCPIASYLFLSYLIFYYHNHIKIISKSYQNHIKIISYHILSYLITSYHILSYLFISYHILSYLILSNLI